jgi:hypothetical protein
MTGADYHRYPSDEKVVGVDYAFLRALLGGAYDDEIARRPWRDGAPVPPASRRLVTNIFYLFETTDGARTLAWGRDPEDALATLALRLGPEARARVRPGTAVRVRQADLLDHRHDLG